VVGEGETVGDCDGEPVGEDEVVVVEVAVADGEADAALVGAALAEALGVGDGLHSRHAAELIAGNALS
jgi:hypothetical protein